jgi:hypothetical protein
VLEPIQICKLQSDVATCGMAIAENRAETEDGVETLKDFS